MNELTFYTTKRDTIELASTLLMMNHLFSMHIMPDSVTFIDVSPVHKFDLI